MLADYIMALVKKDLREEDLLQYCRENLEDFLKDDTATFVDRLFDAARSGSYIRTRRSWGGDSPRQECCDAAAMSGEPLAAAEEDLGIVVVEGPDDFDRHAAESEDDDDGDNERDYKRQRRCIQDTEYAAEASRAGANHAEVSCYTCITCRQRHIDVNVTQVMNAVRACFQCAGSSGCTGHEECPSPGQPAEWSRPPSWTK